MNQGDIVALVRADVIGFVVRLIAERDFDGARIFHDVIVGENVAGGINDEAGAGAFDGNGVVEEIVFDGFRDDVGDGRRGA